MWKSRVDAWFNPSVIDRLEADLNINFQSIVRKGQTNYLEKSGICQQERSLLYYQKIELWYLFKNYELKNIYF